jgi:thiol-disulfide isomerase/thioredoxin
MQPAVSITTGAALLLLSLYLGPSLVPAGAAESSADPAKAKAKPANPEAAWAEILQLRGSLDRELEHNPVALKEGDLSAAAKRIETIADQLKHESEEFIEHFQQHSNLVQAMRQGSFGTGVIGAVGNSERLWQLDPVIERMTRCNIDSLLRRERPDLPLLAVRASALQSAGESGLIDGLLARLPFCGTNQQAFGSMLRLASRARSDLGTKLARQLLTVSNAPSFVGIEAKAVLDRRWRVGTVPQLKFAAIDGREVDLHALRGKVVLINFWATDCTPCVGELPELKALYEKLKPQGFEIVGVSLDVNRESLLRMLKEKDIPWPNHFGGKRFEGPFAAEFGVYGIPDNWLLDRDGRVCEVKADGYHDLEEKVSDLLARK